jgi:hypothetical protein
MPTNGQFAVGELVTASDANTLFMRGYRNRIINGAFVINQRGLTSGFSMASGTYHFDRWRSGFSNTTLTYTLGSQSTTVTISTSGVLQQFVERANMPAGQYVLSWSGTATGRVYNFGGTPPAYGASPQIVTLDGSANVVVEFTASGSTKTLGTVQLEAGPVFSPFEYRLRGEELALCQRYFEKSYSQGVAPGTNTDDGAIYTGAGVAGVAMTTGFVMGALRFVVTKRAVPTIVVYDRPGNPNKVGIDDTASFAFNNQTAQIATTSDSGSRISRTSGNSGNLLVFHYVADAEL